jgi:hypothetical protein
LQQFKQKHPGWTQFAISKKILSLRFLRDACERHTPWADELEKKFKKYFFSQKLSLPWLKQHLLREECLFHRFLFLFNKYLLGLGVVDNNTERWSSHLIFVFATATKKKIIVSAAASRR